MPRISLDRIRNLGIIAHVDAGKTTLTERVLLYTGRIHAAGEVHDGTAHTDSHPLEQQKGITILAAAATCDWRGHRLHLIDTPGHVDFTIEVERSLRVLDGAVVVLDAVAGVEPQTETVWRQADRHRVPRLVFVNKLDRAGADPDRCLRDLTERLGAQPVPITWPVFDGDRLIGVDDLVALERLTWTGDGAPPTATPLDVATLSDNLRGLRERLLEVAADHDDAILAALVEGRPVAPAAVRAALRIATVAGHVVPVTCGSAYQYVGVEPLLDAVVDLLPAPSDRPPVVGTDGATRAPSTGAPLAALAFKVGFDDHGQLTFVRVYSGVLAKGMTVATSRGGRPLRVGRLVQLVAAKRLEVTELAAGEIGAVLATPLAGGETLHAVDAPIVLEAIVAPEPVVRVAIEPATREDRERLPLALARMTAADPSLRIVTDADTGQTLLAGMGQLHLDIAVERLAGEHGVHVACGKPRVAYRSTLGRAVRREHRHVKQSGGPGQFAHVVVELGPAAPGAGLVFTDQTRGGVVPWSFAAAVERGLREAMADGLLGGHPVVDVAAALLDGSTHPKDSSELAFQLAGRAVFHAAAADAAPLVLEPVMRLEITCGDGDVGAVVGDLGRRRGTVLGLDLRGAERVVRAEVPLAETFGYAGALSALTHGRGRFVLEPDRYLPVPPGARLHAA
ncbi:MAG: elongation factor G [Kofleriaceae bacterium]